MEDKTHRISAGALVLKDGKILLVRHRKPGAYDFWVAPGGGVVGDEDLLAAARREVEEEAGIIVEPIRLAYIEDLMSPDQRQCKFWFYSKYVSGEPDCTREEASREFIVDAQFLSRDELIGKHVFPPLLLTDFWDELEGEFPVPRYLGVRKMEF